MRGSVEGERRCGGVEGEAVDALERLHGEGVLVHAEGPEESIGRDHLRKRGLAMSDSIRNNEDIDHINIGL